MNNIFQLVKINKSGKRIAFDYEIKGEWEKYFNMSDKMYIEYGCDIESLPDAVAAIPLISNILPIVWLCNAEVILNELDKNFYTCLPDVKRGYENMYPMLNFAGKVTVAKVIESQRVLKEQTSAAFFSGGVDAYTTLLRHLEECPCLITIWGADIELSDIGGWRKVEQHIQTVSSYYGLRYIAVKSNFREMINAEILDKMVRESKDGWWHGFQHGIGIISHAAPIAWLYGIERIYIASSYPLKMQGKYTCASDATIDNFVKYCGCDIVHDGNEMDRQEKVRYLVQNKELGKEINLRVCWEAVGGGNCCRCEKCYRTILEIVSEGGNPNEFGFSWGKKDIKRCRREYKTKIRLHEFQWEQYYPPIQENLKRNQDKVLNMDGYQWLLKMDVSKMNNILIKKMRYSVLGRRIGRAMHIVKERYF